MDIIERLRHMEQDFKAQSNEGAQYGAEVCHRAAAEIERLTRERDEARLAIKNAYLEGWTDAWTGADKYGLDGGLDGWYNSNARRSDGQEE